MARGQILPESEFGRWLTELASRSANVVEIGGWHGEGSTRCLVEGRPLNLWTVEQDLECLRELHRLYDKIPVTIVEGKALDVLSQLPAEIDLLLLDGDDLTTDDEFDQLFPRCRKWIALDDTNERKNSRQFRLLTELGWRLVAGRSEERNGWAIFEKSAI